MVFPYPELSQGDREAIPILLESVRRFMQERVDSKLIDRVGKIGPEIIAELKSLGLFGMAIPEAYGGSGLSTTAYCRVMQEIAALDSSLAVTLGAHQSIGLKGILLFGTEAQKQRYLPKLATGEWTAAFALTEPSAGSDAAGIKTTAQLSPDGSHYVLNGSKIWITNGGFADVFTVFARTSPPGEGSKPRITAFIVERSMGARTGPEEHKLGIRGSSTTEVYFEDVAVPAANVLGEVGRGFKVAMEILNTGRLGLAAGCSGACRRLVGMAIERCNERQAFGRPIGEFALIREKIGRMMIETYAIESMVYLTTGLIDRGVPDFSIESAICKVYGSEALWRVVNETLQIAAGIGYMQEYPYERLLRDARINLIFEGTNEILRCFIALTGAQGPGTKLAEVARAIREPIKGFGLLSDFAIQRVRTSLGRERLTRAHELLKREAVIFEDFVGELAKNTEKSLRKHGREIAEMQLTQRRLAEIAMDLYAMAAVISRTTRAIERRGEEGAQREIQMCTAFCGRAEHRMKKQMREFDSNDDDVLKAIAQTSFKDVDGYPWDIV
ncbi:MAG: acyl-CoA dehydrogenase family protein [Deltaproteobacteria bacterium]|nr:acyl-CoA dehydrogenase family protein [Deltaproteobacteria bacterium]